eukprot:492326-Rhodomonas_salina.3
MDVCRAQERTSTMYIRRLSKVFNIMGPALTNCYIVGYSRGAAVALDTLVRATGSNKASGSKVSPSKLKLAPPWRYVVSGAGAFVTCCSVCIV